MCDTLVALGKATKDGSVIFAKNSDREPNEAHNIVYNRREQYKKNEKVECTYISIPQVDETYESLLLKPWWMWGCEMGTNEFGLTIGNEAVWSKMPYRNTGLLGMDMIRLALERTKTAQEALNLITHLLEEYGQGGACGYQNKNLTYHNSFIIADTYEAWVLETADKFWIAEKVRDIRSISNTLSITNKYDLIHPDLLNYAINNGFCDSEDDFNFADNFIPILKIKQLGAMGKKRQSCTTNLLKKNYGKITPEIVMAILRNHNIPAFKEKKWSPNKSTMKSPCLHATSFLTPSQTTGSLVSHLTKKIQVHWVTGTSAPCISLFKPIFLQNAGLSEKRTTGERHYNSDNLWWQHEKLHRLTLLDYQKRFKKYKNERDELEKHLFSLVNKEIEKIDEKLTKENIQSMKKITEEAFALNSDKIAKWITKIQDLPIENKPGLFYRRFWKKLNKHDNLELKDDA